MIIFLLKGLIRDRSRSFFPVLTVAFGTFLIVFLVAFFNGQIANMQNSTAHYSSGHVKIMTQAYAAEAAQIPNDLAVIGADELRAEVEKNFDMIWTTRIRFGGLIDIADANGETRVQGPAAGMAIDLSSDSPEINFLNLKDAIVRGRLPEHAGEILIAEEFAEKLQIAPGSEATLISSTMYGSMTAVNFKIAGTVRFGVAAMDKGAIIADLRDIQQALDMENSAGEILGFFTNDTYDNSKAEKLKKDFNLLYQNPEDEFSPVMLTMPEDSGLAGYFAMADASMFIIVLVFVAVMALVLWNAGLIGGLRRYGEMGVRLAVGESKKHIYTSLLWESLLIGIFGSGLGTLCGLLVSYWLQTHGIDYGTMFKNSSMMINNIIRAQVSPVCYIIGFIPGVSATFIGNALAGLGIFKRQTAQLFKELEA